MGSTDNIPVNSGSPSDENLSWRKIDINDRASNVSVDKANGLLRDLVNSDTFFLEDSEVFESSDYFAFTRSSSIPDDHYNPELEVSAKINSSGQLVVNGTVGKSFEAIASYISSYDSQNYYPNQLDEVLRQKASSMFPNVSFDDLDEKSKDLVWSEVKSSKITWDLSLSSTFILRALN